MTCRRCGKTLDVYDEGFYKKMVSRAASPETCVACTAAYYGMSEEKARTMIKGFQKMGCTLFPPFDGRNDSS